METNKNITAFASYRMPFEKDFTSIASTKGVNISSSIDFTKSNRFYLSSFDKKVILYLTPELKKTNELYSCDLKLNSTPPEIKKNPYLHQIEAIKRKIKTNEYDKIVLSRVKSTVKYKSFNHNDLFKKLCKTYPNAFVYMFYSELTGFWIGATPEVLINKKNDCFKTVSLAGTKLINESWTEKEFKEQQIVTDFISNTINEKAKQIKIISKQDLKIGKIKHLKTEINFKLYENDEINQIIEKITPTPAVCGIPQKKAMEYIKKTENHSRSFYTGAIGPIDINNNSNLFVNLRCMQICKQDLALYAGGGITEESNAKSEWTETENKFKILNDLI